MDKQKNTPIELMAQLLADMTERAMNAERERDAECENSIEWYRSYKSKGEELRAVKTELEVTKTALEHAKTELEFVEEKYNSLVKNMPGYAAAIKVMQEEGAVNA